MKKKILQKIIVIVGPTATGKSDLAVWLAKKISAKDGPTSGWNGAEIISADSRQVYKGLDIGSGKITKREMRGVPHHLLNVASPKATYTVSRYKKDAERAIKKIIKKNRIPIIVGGTGLYIDTLLGKVNIPEVKPCGELRRQLAKKTTTELFSILKKLDPRRAREIDKRNPRRLIRAIEIATVLGKVPTIDKKLRFLSMHKILWIGLQPEPEIIKKNIHTRLLLRLKQGMVSEVKKLRVLGLSWKRLEGFGLEYRYVAQYLQKKITKLEMIQKIETESWHYAKRQMRWFKRNKEIKWFSPKQLSLIEKTARKFLK